MSSLQGRTAIVTGAGQGIGEAVARRLSHDGARVAVVDINGTAADRVALSISEDSGTAKGFQCDVSSPSEVERCYGQIVSNLGTPDVLVSNAGISRAAMSWKMTDEQWRTVIDVHVNGGYYWAQQVIPTMIENKWGRILVTTSAAGILGSIGQVNYSTAKAGLLGFVRSLAKELGKYNVLVNAIAPAAATPMTELIRTNTKFSDKYLEEVPLRRWAEPEEIAGIYAFLASEDASYITGQTFAVDGGRTMMR